MDGAEPGYQRWGDTRPQIDQGSLERWIGLAWITPESNELGSGATRHFYDDDYWRELLDEAPVVRRTLTQGALDSPSTSLAFDVRRVERDSNHLTEVTVSLDIQPGDGVYLAQILEVWRRLRMGSYEHLNAPGYRLPNGDLLRFNVIPANEESPPHGQIDVLASSKKMTLNQWVIGQRPELYTDWFIHFLIQRTQRHAETSWWRSGGWKIKRWIAYSFNPAKPSKVVLGRRHISRIGALVGDIPAYSRQEDVGVWGGANAHAEHDTGGHSSAWSAPSRVRPSVPSGYRSKQHFGDSTAADKPAAGSLADPLAAVNWHESSRSLPPDPNDEKAVKACVSIAVVDLGLGVGR
jgi:hypothetical protein